MSQANNFLSTIIDPHRIITVIDAAIRFPEILAIRKEAYADDIERFKALVQQSQSSADLLGRIRSNAFTDTQRISLLKIFRRSVSPVLDTEMAKKIRKVRTETLVETIGHTFKTIELLKSQFESIGSGEELALAALMGEYDSRGLLGYKLTGLFFAWFEEQFKGEFIIDGPRGAGPDIELSSLFNAYTGSFPCDFVIRSANDNRVRAVGFARYDSTRGGSQSDDRTGGNSDKVSKAHQFCQLSGERFRVVFLADGPGLAHRDTWQEACRLDGDCDGAVRVTTLKTAEERITADWLLDCEGQQLG